MLEGKWHNQMLNIKWYFHCSKCNRGRWDCTQNVCPETCSVIGNNHFVTFDGLKYVYQGADTCSYTLVEVRFILE